MENKFFAITTFGYPSKRFRKVHTSEESAREQANDLKGSGTCSNVHILGFATRAAANVADISNPKRRGVIGNIVAVY